MNARSKLLARTLTELTGQEPISAKALGNRVMHWKLPHSGTLLSNSSEFDFFTAKVIGEPFERCYQYGHITNYEFKEQIADLIDDILGDEEEAEESEREVEDLDGYRGSHSDNKARVFSLYSDLGSQSFNAKITHCPKPINELFDEDGCLSQRYTISSITTRDGAIWVNMYVTNEPAIYCSIHMDIETPFSAAYGASFHDLRVEW